MERKIGEIFEYNGEWYQCIVGNDCENCAFNERKCYTIVDNGDPIGDCCDDRRKDNKNVIFKKLERVGEPYEFEGHLFQSYLTFEVPIFTENYATVRELGNNSKISIEIKQNQEDMEEREYSEEEFKSNPRFQHHKNIEQVINMQKMKPFNLEEAKQGKPVCTRDGRKARIICFDIKGDIYPIVAAVEVNGIEYICQYDEKGQNYYNKSNVNKLMMLPEKHEGWVNVYKSHDSRYAGYASVEIYKTKEQAIKEVNGDILATVKIEWEG